MKEFDFFFFWKKWQQAVADIEKAIVEALDKQYADVISPLKESMGPKKFGLNKYVQKLAKRSTCAYVVPDEVSWISEKLEILFFYKQIFYTLFELVTFFSLEFFWIPWRECSTACAPGLNPSSRHGVLACHMLETQHLVSDLVRWQWCWEQSSGTTCKLLWRNLRRMSVAFWKQIYCS